MNSELFQTITEACPSCVTEQEDKDGEITQHIDFDALKQELSTKIIEGDQERFGINWPGKREAIAVTNASTNRMLRPDPENSVNFESTSNIFIEGDNLEALKIMKNMYLGKVKLIYIDPPYNTGNDFVYKDKFSSDKQDYAVASGQVDEDGNRYVANPETAGRYHSNWLSMMYPRLRLAKNFLKRDGVILVSCDENEHPRLRMIMDEIFGERNFISDMVWTAGLKNNAKYISNSHEYIICYAKNALFLKDNNIKWREKKRGLDDIYKEYERLKKLHGDKYDEIEVELKKWFRELPDSHPAKDHKHYDNVDFRGIYFPSDISSPGSDGPSYDVLHPITKKPVKVSSRGWGLSPESMKEMIADNRIKFGIDETKGINRKSYLKEHEEAVRPSYFYRDGRGASKRLRKLMGGKNYFDFPKDETILQEFVKLLTKDDDIVMDFFAGSGSTAHAVMLQNAEDDSNRKFIVVQLDEPVNEKSPTFGKFNFISEISRKRIELAGQQIKRDNPDWDGDIGFRTFKIGVSVIRDVERNLNDLKQNEIAELADNIEKDGGKLNLLFHAMKIKSMDMMSPVSYEENKNFFIVGENNNMVAFFGDVNEKTIKNIAEYQPEYAVFQDTEIKNDAVKTNIEQIMKQFSPKTEIFVI